MAAELKGLLDLAMIPSSVESRVNNFATVELFKTLGYVMRSRLARTRKNIPLLICGEWRHGKADVCIVDRDQNDILLLVQEDKRFGESESSQSDAQAHLIAEAIGAFSYNNLCREEINLPALQFKIIPIIVMAGTTPTFHKITVSAELEFSVRHGQYPPAATLVSKHQPDVPRPNRRWSQGVKPVDARKEILKCYEDFKVIVGI